MDFYPHLEEARFIKRLNRFSALVDISGSAVIAHVAHSGRMGELLIKGTQVFLQQIINPLRKTSYDIILVKSGPVICSIDARLPPYLFSESLNHRVFKFAGWSSIRREVQLEESRIDLVISGIHGQCYVETKCVTLVENGVAYFPDAPTLRGVKHLTSLSKAVIGKDRGILVFVVQRDDAVSFSPNKNADPEFNKALEIAMDIGVEVYAYACKVTRKYIKLDREIPINI